jgi:CubicO group peptidase (beta-lactamase class C family)
MKFISFLLVFIIIPAGIEQVSIAQLHQSKGNSIDTAPYDIAFRMDSLFQILSEHRGFNGNVLIAQEGRILYKHCFGYADFSKRKPLNIRSTFEIASITKQFTAMAIMMLFEKGRLRFSDRVQKFFPEFPYANINIHQLLTHRSGLPDYMDFANRYMKNKKKQMTNLDVMNMLIRHSPEPIYNPDDYYYYSNTNYVVLACIIERISGIDYSDFIERCIFQPLDMRASFVLGNIGSKNTGRNTIGYKRNKRVASEDYLSGTRGDKGIYSTIEDMLKWDQALYTEKLIKQSTLQEAFTPFGFDYQNEKEYGYGWRIDTTSSRGKIVYHGGCWRGYSSLFVRRLTDRSTVIILCNTVNTSFEDIDMLMNIIDNSNYSSSQISHSN